MRSSAARRIVLRRRRDDAIAACATARSKPGDVLVVRGMGVKRRARHGDGVDGGVRARRRRARSEVAFVTDGQLSGLVNKGLVVAEVSPEAAVGGPLALVENGDRISIDVEARTTRTCRKPNSRRGACKLKLADQHSEEGWLAIYERSVQPLQKGAALVHPK